MPRTHDVERKLSGLASRFAAFVAERHPFALPYAMQAFEAAGLSALKGRDAVKLDAARIPLRRALAKLLYEEVAAPEGIAEPTPGISASKRLEQARAELIEACDGFVRRAAIEASLTKDERREMLKGMCLTRSVDNRLKQFFMGGEVRWGGMAFQGKGFRSLGQEAIYAGAIRLKRGPAYRKDDGSWQGDVLAPVIRDLGMTLAMRHDEAAIAMILRAQMGKAGPPMSGKDLHTGDFAWGVLPAAAPLAVGSLSMAGMAMAFKLQHSERVALSFIGEGGSSLGEWHEAINACAAAKLPAIFCLQNNQTALSTPVRDNSAARVFADKAAGYGMPGITIDGTDPDEIAAAFTWAAERARAGEGPALIEIVAMRMCGHAHHDDMLYLGKDQPPSWDYPQLHDTGYANRELYEFWAKRDPIPMYARRLEEDGIIKPGHLDELKKWADELVDRAAQLVINEPWPEPELAGVGVFKDEPPRRRVELLEPSRRLAQPVTAPLPPLEAGLPFDKKGNTFLEAVMMGVGDALAADPRVFVYGEDVGGQYGNAFLLLRPLLKDYGDRLRNSPLAESAVLGVCVGAALAGMRPIGEMQFNDFVATGFNQLVNNAAKIRYRWGGDVPMVVRMPWGGLRHAGPYHSQNTEPWFYRTPGLKIVVPSTPEDARALMAAAVADPDPVLYYEHIALYRDPRVKQMLSPERPAAMPIGKAALRRAGSGLAMISYGAYVHHCMRVADRLASDGIEAAVLDLRSLQPLDKEAVLAVTRHCSRVLIVHEDSKTGGIGESVAAIIQEEAFEALDAPVRVLGALDAPVPYSPPLEEFFLVSEDEIFTAATLLSQY
ncbi:MAG TPA: thiamine pyrophosphate-dependent enzyme [Vicinamibacterales bacterium]|nr:thiamine pyrophosphate-dependent enzyme [Vicinamibacterales bacterium]